MTQTEGPTTTGDQDFDLDGAVAELAGAYPALRQQCRWCGGQGSHEDAGGTRHPCDLDGCWGKGWVPVRDNLTDAVLDLGERMGDWVVSNTRGRWVGCLVAPRPGMTEPMVQVTRFAHGGDLKTVVVKTLLAAHRGDWV